MLTIHALPCFIDNYIWFIACEGGAWVVDPGSATPVLAELKRLELNLHGILITHHHADHTAGVAEILQHHPAPVIGPAEVGSLISQYVSGSESLKLKGIGHVDILAIGAHTLGHIGFYVPEADLVFCGDTLFSAGCGRLFEGTAKDLERALNTLNALPAETRLYPTHEYTSANLAFAHAVEPENSDITAHQAQVQQWRAENRPSLPTTLSLERRINPFLRCNNPEVVAHVSAHEQRQLSAGVETLAALRRWKDIYKS